MEHPCHRCGSPVDDSSPFCPDCDAPQIRVSGNAESSAQNFTVPFTPQLVVASEPLIFAPVTPATTKGRFRSAAVSGIAAGLISVLPLGIVLGPVLAGVLAVILYRRRSGSSVVPPADAFKLGSLSGLFAYLIFLGLESLDVVMSHGENEIRDSMIEAVKRQQARNPDPQARQMLDYFLTPHGVVVMIVAGIVISGIAFVLFSGLAALFTSTLLRGKRR